MTPEVTANIQALGAALYSIETNSIHNLAWTDNCEQKIDQSNYVSCESAPVYATLALDDS